MAHESHTTTLGRGAEEGNLGLIAAELLGEGQHGLPRGNAACVPVVLDSSEVRAEGGISLDNSAPSDLQDRDERGSEIPEGLMLVPASTVREEGGY